MDDEPEDSVEKEIEAHIASSAPVVTGYSLENFLMERLTSDLAQRIGTIPEIACRYGLSMENLRDLVANPAIKKIIKIKQAEWESDASTPARAKAQAQAGTVELGHTLYALIGDDSTPLGQRIEIFKAMTEVGGLRGGGVRTTREADNAPAGAPFSININFSGGKVETIVSTAPTLEGQAE